MLNSFHWVRLQPLSQCLLVAVFCCVHMYSFWFPIFVFSLDTFSPLHSLLFTASPSPFHFHVHTACSYTFYLYTATYILSSSLLSLDSLYGTLFGTPSLFMSRVLEFFFREPYYIFDIQPSLSHLHCTMLFMYSMHTSVYVWLVCVIYTVTTKTTNLFHHQYQTASPLSVRLVARHCHTYLHLLCPLCLISVLPNSITSFYVFYFFSVEHMKCWTMRQSDDIAI